MLVPVCTQEDKHKRYYPESFFVRTDIMESAYEDGEIMSAATVKEFKTIRYSQFDMEWERLEIDNEYVIIIVCGE